MPVLDPVHNRADLDALLRTCTNYERMPAFHQGRVRVDLDRMHAILGACDHPEHAAPAVHITGSKGKGSTAMLCARILETLGPVGLHTSPHLQRMEERVCIGSRPIEEAALLAATNELLAALRILRDLPGRASDTCSGSSPGAGSDAHGFPTFFEYITLVAFLGFRAAEVRFQIHEAGMGGRLDATNVLAPAACAITNVDLEHTAVLGETASAIAEEKAGIVKPGVPFFTAEPLGTEARRVLDRIAREAGVKTLALGEAIQVRDSEGCGAAPPGHLRLDVTTPSRRYEGLEPALLGRHQASNLALAIGLAEEAARAVGEVLDPAAVARAIRGVTLPGRLERVSSDPLIYLDGAHTGASVRSAFSAVREAHRDHGVVVVLAMASDKHRAEVAAVLTEARHVVTCAYDHPRASDPEELLAEVLAAGGRGETAVDPQKALARARELAEDRNLVLVMGSLYLVGAIRVLFHVG